ncbi:MAG: hypothetical protein WC593_10890 [Methanoregula sp.]
MREYRDGELINKLIETLKQQGVSEDSIALEWPIDNKHRVDLAIIDDILNKPIALFEVKGRKDKRSVDSAEQQVRNYASILNEQNIPLFIVFPDPSNDSHLEISQVKQEPANNVKLTEKIGIKNSVELKGECRTSTSVTAKLESEKTFSDQIPNISVLANSARQKTLFDLLKKKENAIENFQFVCWGMGGFGILVLLLNFANILVLTPERIALFGVVFGLFLLPFASKIKIFGFEFERIKNAEK